MVNTSSRKEFFRSLPEDVKLGVEVGVSHGDFSRILLSVRPDLFLYLVDVWTPNYQLPEGEKAFKAVQNNLAEYFNRYKAIKLTSVSASEKFSDNSLDFVYIDAGHHYEEIKEDIKVWYPKVKSGGYFCGHDYSPTWSGVVQAVDEFVSENEYDMILINAKGLFDGDQDGGSPSWAIVKR